MPWPGGGLSRSLPGWAASLASRSLTSSALILSLVLGLTSSLGGISASHQTRPAASPWPSPEAGVRGQLAQSAAGRTDSEVGGQHDPGQQPLSEPLLRPLHDEASDSAASRSARSPSNHSLLLSHSLTQCLPSLQSDSAAVTAGHICRCADTWTRVWLTLHNPNPVFTSQCWDRTPSHRDYCLPPVLTPSELANIESPEAIVCEAQVESLLSRVRAHTSLMEESIKVLQSAGSSTHCHNASHCQACAGWYLTWACLQSWPLYHGRSGLVLAPCPNSCSLVQTSCPFLTIHEDASMAAGDPTFICQDSSITSPSANIHATCCYEVRDQSPESPPIGSRSPASAAEAGSSGCSSRSYSESVPVPGEGEFVDLNTTDCCSPSWGHPEAGDHTHHCDTVLQRDRRTLVVRRRTTAEMTSILQDSSWLESIYIVSDLLSEANHPCEHCHHARVLLTSIMTFLCGYFKS